MDKPELIEALEKSVELMQTIQGDLDDMIAHAGGTSGFGQYNARIKAFRDFIAEAKR